MHVKERAAQLAVSVPIFAVTGVGMLPIRIAMVPDATPLKPEPIAIRVRPMPQPRRWMLPTAVFGIETWEFRTKSPVPNWISVGVPAGDMEFIAAWNTVAKSVFEDMVAPVDVVCAM